MQQRDLAREAVEHFIDTQREYAAAVAARDEALQRETYAAERATRMGDALGVLKSERARLLAPNAALTERADAAAVAADASLRSQVRSQTDSFLTTAAARNAQRGARVLERAPTCELAIHFFAKRGGWRTSEHAVCKPFPAEEASGKRGGNADAGFTSCLALREGKIARSHQGHKTNRTTESLLLSSLSVSCRFSNNHNNNTRPLLGCIAPHPLGTCCLCW